MADLTSIGKYRVIRELGAGGFGAVYLCEDPLLKEQVAIKVFQIRDANLARQATSASGDVNQILRERFLSEARVLRQLSANPNIVDVYDFAELDDGTPYYVMPYLGHSLVEDIGKDAMDAAVIADLPPEQRPRRLPPAQAGDILQQLLGALAAVHAQGLIHRDIKPANILFNTSGAVQLCDFGIAKLPDAEYSQTGSGMAMGSRNYMAPEQRESAKHVDTRADIYAVGVLAYRLYTGMLPVGRFDDPITLCPAMGEAMSELILRCLNYAKEQRPRDASQLQQLLKAALQSQNNTAGTEPDEHSGTWVEPGQGEAKLKAQLSPLEQRIEALLKEHAEIPASETLALNALAAVGGLDEAGLHALIAQTENRLSAELTPKKNFLAFLDKRLADGAPDAVTLQALEEAAVAVGWNADKLKALLKARLPDQPSETAPKAKPVPQARQTGQREKRPAGEAPSEAKRSNKAMIIGAALVPVLGLGLYFGFADNSPAPPPPGPAPAVANQTPNPNPRPDPSTKQDAEREAEAERQAEQQAAEQVARQATRQQILLAQHKLSELGYTVAQDGALNTRTIAAIKAFEGDRNLVVVGEVDATLLQALDAAIKEQQQAAEAERRAQIQRTRQAQSHLKTLGYSVSVDGAAGPNTSRAVKEFQQSQNLPQSGEIDEPLIASLAAAVEAKQRADAKAAEAARKARERKPYEPEMVSIPAGTFRMGDLNGGGDADEKPVHSVNIKPFKMSKYEITFAQWDACVSAGGCSHTPDDEGWGRGNRPVVNVSYDDITQQYLPWLKQSTGKGYRLPTEAEWEYAARAGTSTKYSWGNGIDCSKARYGYTDCNSNSTVEVGRYSPNAFGLYDMHGNVWEWVEDCWNGSYNGAPGDGSAWGSGDCGRRVLRGGSWLSRPRNLRSALRNRIGRANRNNSGGFRLVQD